MYIQRIDRKKEIGKQCERIVLEIGDREFVITEYFGNIKIHASHDEIVVKPCCRNEIEILAVDR